MADIVNINIGQAGVRIGHEFWSRLRKEHGIDEAKPAGILSFFEEKSKGYESRSIFIDHDQRQLDKLNVANDPLYNRHDLITCVGSSRGMYAESAYTVFPEMKEEIMDRIRRRVERCDTLSGFLVISSLGGGTSSGLGTRVNEEIRNIYPDRMMQTVKLMPDLDNAHPLEIYNCTNSIHREVEFCDLTMLFDNSWAQRGVAKAGGGLSITALNRWVAANIAECTIPYRFSGLLNTNQRKIATNLVLFPRLHFLSFGNARSLTAALRPDVLSLTNYYGGGGKIFNIYAGVRDSLSSENEADCIIREELQRHQLTCVDWMPRPFHLSLHDPESSAGATVIVNSYNMHQYFTKISQRFTATFQRRGFYCWYSGVGLDSMEFTEMESNLNDLTSELMPYDNYDIENEYSQMSDEAE